MTDEVSAKGKEAEVGKGMTAVGRAPGTVAETRMKSRAVVVRAKARGGRSGRWLLQSKGDLG